jgi:hypothetical protein
VFFGKVVFEPQSKDLSFSSRDVLMRLELKNERSFDKLRMTIRERFQPFLSGGFGA